MIAAPWTAKGPALRALDHGKWHTIAIAADTLTPAARHELAAQLAALPALLAAARNVVARWESGDLAGAVRELDSVLHDIEGQS